MLQAKTDKMVSIPAMLASLLTFTCSHRHQDSSGRHRPDGSLPPGWNTSFHAQLVGMGITTSPKASVLTDEPESYGCLTDRVSLTWSREIAQGIDYLRRVSGMAKNGP
ncbi:hypothetical protein QC761_403755 [Podospora bellae-mahoneyi]|uniref:Uncharacterized protein n=1 Tax=Podospora bellae-mahoneyi TaxID=2093777 RepID=A0ABR0FGW4_9PEZI|nr:hypothetical protein QC761_403755 [Podospora bellae-mahoneyi]